MTIKCPHCDEEIEISVPKLTSTLMLEPIPKSEATFLDCQEWYVEDTGEDSFAKYVFGRPTNEDELQNWKDSWKRTKDSMESLEYRWEIDEERGLKIITNSYHMFFQDPFPDTWFFFWLPDDNYFRQKYFEQRRLRVDNDGRFYVDEMSKDGKWPESDSCGVVEKERVEKYKKRLEGIVPDNPREDTFFL